MDEQITVEKIKARIRESLSAEPGLPAIQTQKPSLDLVSPPIGSSAQEGQRMAFKELINSHLWKYGTKYARVIKQIPVLKSMAQKQYYRLSFDYYARPLSAQPRQQPAQDLVDMPWSYNRFRKQAGQEGLKGKIKLFLFTCLGFFASWQEQINAALFQAIELMEQSLAEQQSRSEAKLIHLESSLNKTVGSVSEKLEKSLAEQQSQSESRLMQLEDMFSKTVGSVSEKLDQLTSIGSDIPDVLVTRGQIDSDSYLSLALEGSASSLAEMKSNNKDEDVFYYLLENLFRGSLEVIKARQSIYLPYVKETQKSKGKYFLDLGCGRGEFLSLLQGQSIKALGVDSNGLMRELLEQQGLDFTQSDALEYLQGLKNNLLTGLSMFQVIEHLDFKYVNTLLQAAFKKIAQSGIIILESINPYCPVATRYFYTDPTHITLYSPDTIRLLLEWYGFNNIKIVYSSPIPSPLRLKETVMNYYDYAVIGEKPKLRK